ncbi:glycosyltransferase family 61 protein [Paracoccus sp. PS-1]|uniref:glycosyltransferase 61 family protein n=1 Tax=unclassified Paracoccus (in: a-proteobacteria) TaxID=2688777 RepID=UPI0004BCC2BF|nr:MULTISPECIES: glycosyltransferase family 61 protein [unclassified Paracoccus (in: a-proteobacteria)]MDQ7260700.1 glycosyltransferase family 61 protein [Paracoccus sp. PS1]
MSESVDYIIVDDAIILPPSEDENGRLQNASGVFDRDGRPVDIAVSLTHGRPRHAPVEYSAPEAPEFIPGTHIFGGIFFGHFGHFITESTGRLWALDDPAFGTRSALYIPKAGPVNDAAIKAQTALLAALGISAEIRVAKGPTRVERLVVPRQEFGLGPDLISGSGRFVAFARSAAEKVAPAGAEKLYISRRDLPFDRGTILGETLVEALLEREGYRIWLPHRCSKEEQVAQYRAARQIISVDASPLHLLAYVAQPHQQIAIIKRRSMNAVDDIVQHLESFGGSQVTVIDRLVANHVHARLPRIGRSSWGEVDLGQVGQELKALGLIEDTSGWRNLTEDEIAAQIAVIEAGMNAKYVRKPVPEPAPAD